MKYKRIRQLLKYGWRDAGEISKEVGVKQSRISLYWDIISSFKKYYLFSDQYKKNKVWSLAEEERNQLCLTIGASNKKRDQWIDRKFTDWAFLNKYSTLKWQKTPKLMRKRMDAYIHHYGLNKDTKIQSGVTLTCEHCSIGKIDTGHKVLLARNVNIDYTGGIKMGNGVSIAEGSKILTHGHTYLGFRKDFIDKKSRAYLTPLTIEDNVFIGAHVIIMPGVGIIGENSMISAGSVVTKPIPANSMVSGNPAIVTATIPKGMRTFYRYKKQ